VDAATLDLYMPPYGWPTRTVHQSEQLRRDGACHHDVLQQMAASAAPLHEEAGVCVLMHVGVAQASTRLQQENHRAPCVFLESMQRKTQAHHVLTVMHQAGMCVWLDQQVVGVSSADHISCVPAAHPAACPSPSYPFIRLRLSCLSAPFTSQPQCHSLKGAAGAREEEEEEAWRVQMPRQRW
jgi:hypothetical protein